MSAHWTMIASEPERTNARLALLHSLAPTMARLLKELTQIGLGPTFHRDSIEVALAILARVGAA